MICLDGEFIQNAHRMGCCDRISMARSRFGKPWNDWLYFQISHKDTIHIEINFMEAHKAMVPDTSIVHGWNLYVLRHGQLHISWWIDRFVHGSHAETSSTPRKMLKRSRKILHPWELNQYLYNLYKIYNYTWFYDHTCHMYSYGLFYNQPLIQHSLVLNQPHVFIRFSRFSIWFFQPANIRVTCVLERAFILTILPDWCMLLMTSLNLLRICGQYWGTSSWLSGE